MGFGDAFDFQSAGDIFAEHAALSAFENEGDRDFDLGAIAALPEFEYDAMPPLQWPQRQGAATAAAQRFFADGGYFTADQHGRFIAVEALPAEPIADNGAFPLRLNTGRVRDQWHTMTRTGKTPRLAQHIAEPYVEVHPDDARRFGVTDGGLARVRSVHGEAILRVVINLGQRPGAVFAPIHWSGENTSHGRIGALVHGITDPNSGQPDSKATGCRLEPAGFKFEGFVLARDVVAMPAPFWVKVRLDGGWLYKVAFTEAPAPSWAAWTAGVFAIDACHLLQFSDPKAENYRAAWLDEGRFAGCAFLVTAGEALPGWDWLASLLKGSSLDETSRRALLAGRAMNGAANEGALICACFGVGRNRIAHAVAVEECQTVEAIGASLRAGTNCGSCIPELRKIIASESTRDAA